MEANVKACTKCGEIKELTEFFKANHTKDKRRSNCKQCSKNYDKQFFSDPERLAQRRKKNAKRMQKYRIEHPEKVKESEDKYRKNNLERLQKRGRELYEIRKDIYNERRRKQRCDNPIKARALSNARAKRAKENLTDHYVRNMIVNGSNIRLKLKEIPKELIEAKRLQLLIRRMAHENSNDIAK
jgi:hypothetical protein